MRAGERLFGRDGEVALLDRLLGRAASAHGGALVIRGEPGIGKTALLEWVSEAAGQRDMRVLTAAGVENESRLPYAALHQLLYPLNPANPVLRAAFGLAEGRPDLYAVALAALEVIADAAARRPIALVIDDLHWLDSASADVLAFVGRRVGSDAVLAVGATRTVAVDDPQRRSGIAELMLDRLTGDDSAALLDTHAPQLSPAVRERLLTEAAGNPLALVELPRSPAPAGAPTAAWPLNSRLEATFAARAGELGVPESALLLILAADAACDARRLLEAATETAGEPVTVRHAQRAIDTGLIEAVGNGFRFRHPLVRSAIYQRAPLAARLDAHRCLAARLTAFPDRRLWHLASATLGPDADLAADLERHAEQARQRGATMSAVAALQRAAELAELPGQSTALVLRAAELASEIGARHEVERLLTATDLSALGPAERARLANVHEVVRFQRFTDPAQRVRELIDVAEAAGDAELRTQLLWRAASRCFFQATGPAAADARARIAALVDGDGPLELAILAYTVPEERGAEILDRLQRLADGGGGPDVLRFLGSAALVLGDFARSSAWLDEAVADARAQGRMAVLARLLTSANWGRLWLGGWDQAGAELTESRALVQDTGEVFYAVASQTSTGAVAAMRGDLDEAERLLDEVATSPLAAGMSYIQIARVQARGLVHLFRGEITEAYAVLARTFDPASPTYHRFMRWWLVPELLDAALAAQRVDEARALVAGLPRVPSPMMIIAAEYAASLLDDAPIGPETARWPLYRARLQLHRGRTERRRHRIGEARDLLRAARDTFDTLGAVPWAEMARTELRAAGESSRRRVSSARESLSPQEMQIAGLAAEGLTNRQIAERLFLSHRTVGSHLYRIYPKLGVTRRAQLAGALTQ
ncbi:ATP-binding protein [Actinoplanes couchii]|uniref:Transcriptional regulator n=1 Tax=Actinoplanes couchii TaxID=403638 RepID=A0ABQ3X237_9ACTN|nr:LuxR family transcriptional regulator [Actinoplanes couchii]MDR6316933.1 DNA-binding CsgD family transcriptional regulator/nucleoside-triphosphatase THEP1 [Actinoplanes couchii]GID52541.1 transcriptional regulator [Actinoplanes couchii]